MLREKTKTPARTRADAMVSLRSALIGRPLKVNSNESGSEPNWTFSWYPTEAESNIPINTCRLS
jgi:hypothetical protein